MKRTILLAIIACAITAAFCVDNDAKAPEFKSPPAKTVVVARDGTKLIYVNPTELQVAIAEEHRIYNQSGFQCGWCALETLGRHHKIESLYGITKVQRGFISGTNGKAALRKRNVKFEFQSSENKDVSILREYVAQKQYGAAVGLHGAHMIVICHFDETNGIVKVIDNQGPQALKIQTWSMEKFMDSWDGCVFVVKP